MGFREDGSPRPHYLGRLTDQTSLDDLEKLIPERGVAPEEPEILDDRSFPAFRRKMEAAIQAVRVPFLGLSLILTYANLNYSLTFLYTFQNCSLIVTCASWDYSFMLFQKRDVNH